jgi:lipid A 3-O-deacylase
MRVRGLRSRVWLVSAAAAAAFLAAVASAHSADMPPADAAAAPPPPAPPAVYTPAAPQTPAPGDSFEARFGAFYHGVGSVEQNTYDLSGALVSPRLNFGLQGYWAYLLPRFDVGGSYNTGGRTSFAYVDMLLTLPITSWLFFEPFLGGAVHNGSLTPTPTFSGLGCPLLFHAGWSFGFPITEHWSALATFEHLSNGKGIFGTNCGTNQVAGTNQGLNNYGIRIGYSF